MPSGISQHIHIMRRNELISVKDPLSNITTYGYDAEGNNTTVDERPREYHDVCV